MQTYVDLCDKTKPGEKLFCHLYGMMCNSAFDVLGATENSGLGNYRRDVKPVLGSEGDNIPDTLGVLRAMFTSSGNDVDQMKDNGPEHNFSWAQTMHWQEFKPKLSFLDEGTDARYRVLSDAGEDPRDEIIASGIHRKEASLSKGILLMPPSLHALGQRPDVSDARNRSENLTALNSLREGVVAVDEPTTEEEHKACREVMLQCGRYALEILSSAGFHTHCIGALVTVERIQLLYYDCSIIIVCKPIVMFKSVDDSETTTTVITDEFGALLIGLSRLTLKQRGIQEQFCVDRALIENYETYMKRCGKVGQDFDQRDIFKGVKLLLKLKLGKGDKEVEVEVTLGRILSCQPAIIGRHTCVVEAESAYEGWKGKKIVIKISWPAIERKSEADLVKIARDKARTMKTGKKSDWALDHLPDILLCQDSCYDADSTQANIAAFCKKAKCAENEMMDCEHRVCRIMVQEKLYSLEELQTVEEYAQVFFDILQIHKWLYDHPRIIHRDISPGNIIWRRTINGHRTGTLPFMAYDLLINNKNGQPPKHLYRHDVESVFYVILLLCCRYKVLATPTSSEPAPLTCDKVSSPFDDWYRLGRATLKDKKIGFIMGDTPAVNSGFAAFQPWLDDLHQQFLDGHSTRTVHSHRRTRGKATGAFDEETLQNQVSYSIVLDICSKFAGSPLIVHNDQLEEAT
ncbi:hypothetical protein EV421DRAFT_1997239 [Armillaria borealis]|uniref:Fungal-type protein kinase domain-containing protein n=1 Tax=Armillaria borealis TaxID=47425 RepID=A0AA39IZK1_9AGAR|nr:hypothetical protein EV421DRAFT_1997239 [Armillaria borealis]